MGRDAQQRFPLAQIEPHEPEVQHLQVPESAVHDARGGGRRAAAEIAPLEERDPQPAQRRIPRDAAADDAAADDRDVERSRSRVGTIYSVKDPTARH